MSEPTVYAWSEVRSGYVVGSNAYALYAGRWSLDNLNHWMRWLQAFNSGVFL